MAFELPALPYALDALEPYLSRTTLDVHYGKHHQGYVDKLNKLAKDAGLDGASLEAVIEHSTGGLFNNAAQVWNHTFYWHSMRPAGGDGPQGAFAEQIDTDFGSLETFKKQFTDAALGQFGSGWAWLVQRPDGSLAVETTGNAETPLTTDNTPLLTCDVWEHAYYLDRRNDRGAYMEAWWEVVNWAFAAENARLADSSAAA